MKIIVVGAGALGGWTALMLRRKGYQVHLVDGHGPGNARASSGDETRVIRTLYKDEIYTRLTLQSMQLWEENEILFGERILFRTGVINFIGRDQSRWLAAKDHLTRYNVSFVEMDNTELISRFPLISDIGIRYSVLENGGGYLRARAGCEAVVKQFVKEGGHYIQQFVTPIPHFENSMSQIELAGGDKLEADAFVFAAGPWLPFLLPQFMRKLIRPSKQDLFYFGMPAIGHRKKHLPVWCDFATLDDDVMYYGIPATDISSGGFGFKVAKDVAGPDFDPEWGERTVEIQNLENVRRFMEQRFPFMKKAPLVQTRVCQYENTADAHLIVDKVPGTENLWVAGGGSGHGYKLGAAIGEYLSNRIEGTAKAEPLLSFDRLNQVLDGDTRR